MKFKLLIILISLTLFAEIANSQDPQPKDTTTGTLFSVLITGGGHFYAKEYRTGATLLGLGIGAPVIGAIVSDSDNYTPLFNGIIIGFSAYIFGIINASNAVNRYNAKHGFSVNRITVGPAIFALSQKEKNFSSGLQLNINF